MTAFDKIDRGMTGPNASVVSADAQEGFETLHDVNSEPTVTGIDRELMSMILSGEINSATLQTEERLKMIAFTQLQIDGISLNDLLVDYQKHQANYDLK